MQINTISLSVFKSPSPEHNYYFYIPLLLFSYVCESLSLTCLPMKSFSQSTIVFHPYRTLRYSNRIILSLFLQHLPSYPVFKEAQWPVFKEAQWWCLFVVFFLMDSLETSFQLIYHSSPKPCEILSERMHNAIALFRLRPCGYTISCENHEKWSFLSS